MNLFTDAWYRLVATFAWSEVRALRAERVVVQHNIIDLEEELTRKRAHLAQVDAAIAENERDVVQATLNRRRK